MRQGALGDADEPAQSQRLSTELGQPILGGRRLGWRPLRQQPRHDPWRVGLVPPAVGGAHTASNAKRALHAPAALTPPHTAPGRGRQLPRHLLHTLRPSQPLRGRIAPRPPQLFRCRRGPRQVRVFSPDHGSRLDLDRIVELALTPCLAATEVIAIGRIGQGGKPQARAWSIASSANSVLLR
jgi:hypothetical protein